MIIAWIRKTLDGCEDLRKKGRCWQGIMRKRYTAGSVIAGA